MYRFRKALTVGSAVFAYQQTTNQQTLSHEVETAYLFRTYKNLHRSKDPEKRCFDKNPGPAHDIPIWEVARATSAAPTYFKAPKIDNREYLDGGFGPNNPSLEIYEEVRTMNNQSNECVSIVLSIGTGKNNKLSRWTQTTVPGFRYINHYNFAKGWASQSEEQHGRMLKEQVKFNFVYKRLNVQEGLDKMKLDEWRTRARLRIGLGQFIGKSRKRFKKHAIARSPATPGEKTYEESTSSTSQDTLMESDLLIPEWLRYRNKTLEKIALCTENYLKQDEVKNEIKKCAVILVEGRRDRARADPQRWEKACYSA